MSNPFNTAHPLRLFNSWSRSIEDFKPINPNNVGIYTCGPTVYNYAHIGNLRAYVFADSLRRTLNWKGYNVNHVINITDVGHLVSDADEGEDKMERAAQSSGNDIWKIAAHYTQAFKEDVAALNILAPSVWSTATDHIQDMIDFACDIESKGFTYKLDSGLYFDTSQTKNYGWLGRINADGQNEGARVDAVDGKKQNTDFAVWRSSPKDEQRLMEWQSPWGAGAPGWHLECSVMSMKYLGEQFDIHTGGIDHREIHHSNEIAQNQARTGDCQTGANIWMHNAFLIDKTGKMSKSKGGFITLNKIVACGVHPSAYRLQCLSGHYRRDLDFSHDVILSSVNRLKRIAHHIEKIRDTVSEPSWLRYIDEISFSKGASFAVQRSSIEANLGDEAKTVLDRFDKAISDDLMVPEALPLIEVTLSNDALTSEEKLSVLASMDLVLGLGLTSLSVSDFNLMPNDAALTDDEVNVKIKQRQDARQNGDYALADSLRDELTAAGIELMDRADTTWTWVPNLNKL